VLLFVIVYGEEVRPIIMGIQNKFDLVVVKAMYVKLCCCRSKWVYFLSRLLAFCEKLKKREFIKICVNPLLFGIG
jgi:hypothetical protein